MTDKETLTRAVAQAKRNGFDIHDDFFVETPAEVWLQPNQDLYFSIIFDHEFAKNFFPDSWESHLQEMVLFKKPLDYLINFIKTYDED